MKLHLSLLLIAVAVIVGACAIVSLARLKPSPPPAVRDGNHPTLVRKR